MSLSLYEQETIINYNQGEAEATIFTYSKSLISRPMRWRCCARRRPARGSTACRRSASTSRSRETLARQKENALSAKAKKHTPQGCASGLKTRR